MFLFCVIWWWLLIKGLDSKLWIVLCFLNLCFFRHFIDGKLIRQFQVSMAPLQPPTNFKHKFFWGSLVLGNSNLVSSFSVNVVSINPVPVGVPPIEVSE
jgi:hypothetical protein